jgi:hypothetical protein
MLKSLQVVFTEANPFPHDVDDTDEITSYRVSVISEKRESGLNSASLLWTHRIRLLF